MPESIETRRCIYCFKDKPLDEFSLEHIWPDALGGRLCSEALKTRDVCGICNNRCGLFVDGAFIKSWFVQMEIANQGYLFLDPEKPSAAPFAYFGAEPEITTEEGEVCERWQGLAGERIYHFHLADKPGWDTYAGGDIIRRRREDAGRAYMALTSSHQFWTFTAALSFREQFSRAKRVVLTEVASDDPDHDRIVKALFSRGDPADEVQARDEARLADALDRIHVHTRIEAQANFDGRFLCKLALGLGRNILGVRHGESAYGAELRRGLWERNASARQDLRIRGTGMLGEGQAHTQDRLKDFLNWPGCWSLLIMKHGEDLAAHVHTPSGVKLSVVIAEQLSLYGGVDLEPYVEGQIYFISMPNATFVGPVWLPEVLAHKLGAQVSQQLAGLDPSTDRPPLPPKR